MFRSIIAATEKFPGGGAFDHLEWTYDGAFSWTAFRPREGGIFQKFSKNSNARGVAGGMFKLWFDWYIRFQKSNDLPMSRKCGQSVTTDDRWTFTEVSSADKDKVHLHRSLGDIGKDATCLFDCRVTCQIYVTSVIINAVTDKWAVFLVFMWCRHMPHICHKNVPFIPRF